MATLKVKNNVPFLPVGDSWSTWIPSGITIHVFISADSVDEHFTEIGSKSVLSGPDTFQCCGFNDKSWFKITGLGNTVLEVLV